MVPEAAVGAAGVPVKLGLAKLAFVACNPPLAPNNSLRKEVPEGTPKYSELDAATPDTVLRSARRAPDAPIVLLVSVVRSALSVPDAVAMSASFAEDFIPLAVAVARKAPEAVTKSAALVDILFVLVLTYFILF